MTEIPAYDDVMVADLEIMTSANNYRDWMYRRMAPYIGRRVLEVGAGIGNFTSLLLDRDLIVATDKYEKCVDYLQRRLGDNPKLVSMPLDLAEPDPSMAKFDLDTIICINVLEHVEDDAAALNYMHSVLVPGGRTIIFVPAFQFLHGTIDTAIGHYRRYTRKTLLPMLINAGFAIENSYYMNVIGMTGWFWNNRIRRIEEENVKQIKVFDKFIAPWAEALERVLPPPFGLSLIVIGRKK
jgi:SAM-dependent methyltransferase